MAEALVDANEARRSATPWPLDPPLRREAIRLRQAEIEAGPVSMGADFATGGTAEEWTPMVESPTPPWLPQYPLRDDSKGALCAAPQVLSHHYDQAKAGDMWWDVYWP